MSAKKVSPARRKRNATTAEKRGELIPAIGYLRASSDKQDTSCKDQKKEILDQVKDEYNIVAWYVDDGVSGWKTASNRQGFQNAMAHAKRGDGGAKTIVVWKQNRFSRMRPSKLTRYLDEMRDESAYLHVLDYGTVDPDDMSDLLQAIIKGQADYNYCSSLSTDVHRGMKRRAEQGYWLRASPMGYGLTDPKATKEEGKRLVINDEEAEIVRYIFELFLGGLSTNKIAAKLNREKVETYSVRRGHRKRRGYSRDTPETDLPFVCDKWTPTQVNQVLTNDVYIGNYHWGRACNSEFEEYHDVIFIAGNHDPIVSKPDFERAARLLKSRAVGRRKQTRSADQRAILGGLLRCGYCSQKSSANGVMYKVGANDESSYTCRGVRTGCCNGNRVSVTEVLDAVIPRIAAHFDSPEIKESLRQKMMQIQRPSEEADVDELQERLNAKKSKLDIARRNLALVSPEHIRTVEASISELKAEVLSLENKVANASRPIEEVISEVDEQVADALSAFKDLGRAYTEGDWQKLRCYLEEFVEEIVVFAERERGVLSELWESMPEADQFTIDDLNCRDLKRKQLGNRVTKLVHQGCVEVIKGRGGKGPGIYRRTNKPPKEAKNTYYKLVRGEIKLQSRATVNLASTVGHRCNVEQSVSLTFDMPMAA